jgi:transposase
VEKRPCSPKRSQGVHDVLLPDVDAKIVPADKGYDADVRVLELLARAGKERSSRPNVRARTYDKHLNEARYLIENFFVKLKQFRAIATRHEKTAHNFLAASSLNRHCTCTSAAMAVYPTFKLETVPSLTLGQMACAGPVSCSCAPW